MFKTYDYKTMPINTQDGVKHAVVAISHCGCNGWKYQCEIEEMHTYEKDAENHCAKLINSLCTSTPK